MENKSYNIHFTSLILLLCFCIVLNLSLGSVSIPLNEIFNSIFFGEASKESWFTIINNFRLPKAITAILVGSGLAISGLFMQTLFRNPLAGPFVLGISSGASLGVALLMLGASLFSSTFFLTSFSSWSLPVAASIGSFLVLLAIIIAANKVKNVMSVLIIGLMFSSFASAIISVLSYFSNAEQLQAYIFWGFGSLANLSWLEIKIFLFIYLVAVGFSFGLIKPLNGLLLGEHYAKSVGINNKKNRNFILLITSILTGIITAFTGPIAFIGLAIPHMARLIFVTSNHKILIPASLLIGAIVLLLCDCIAQLPNSEYTLPINAITSLFGAPIVIWLLMRKRSTF